ncbi:fucolectin-like [Misgurnus anguillicaudatus]|uniref:fucolectin-like n=1 Tax=Misgurnus anguillicaudatus TaxID=75329 RepID=UPI003CCFA59E
MVGRYINVVVTGRTCTLALCEVEVYDTENIARKGTVIQPSTYNTRVAKNAIDGIRYGSVEAYCSCTGLEATPWWRLDLLDYYTSTIIITARSDGYFGETNGAEIRIGNSLENNGNNNPICGVVSGVTGSTSTFSYACDGMEGRYVNVILPGPGHLTVCEMEVYGKRVLKKSILRLKFLSRVDAAALSDKILSQLQSALSLYISDFKLSWTQRPYKVKVKQQNTGKYKVRFLHMRTFMCVW